MNQILVCKHCGHSIDEHMDGVMAEEYDQKPRYSFGLENCPGFTPKTRSHDGEEENNDNDY